MLLNGIKMQYQTNEFANEVMTYPEWQNSPDTIRMYGCLLCAKLNAYNLYNKDKNYMTIKQLNDKMKEKSGYLYLFYMDKFNNDIVKVRGQCFGKESYQIPEVINNILGIGNEIKSYRGKIDIGSKNDFFIVKTKYKDTGHYSMAYNANLAYFDSYDGKLKNPYDLKIPIIDVIKIIFN